MTADRRSTEETEWAWVEAGLSRFAGSTFCRAIQRVSADEYFDCTFYRQKLAD
jgi:hypothetical protein